MDEEGFENPPLLGDKEYCQWKREVDLWQSLTELNKSKQGLALALSLEGKARKVAVAIPIEKLMAVNGVEIILLVLDNLFVSRCTFCESIYHRVNDCPHADDGKPTQNGMNNCKEENSVEEVKSNIYVCNYGPNDEKYVLTFENSKSINDEKSKINENHEESCGNILYENEDDKNSMEEDFVEMTKINDENSPEYENKIEEICKSETEEVGQSETEKAGQSETEEVGQSEIEENPESRIEENRDSKIEEDHDSKIETDLVEMTDIINGNDDRENNMKVLVDVKKIIPLLQSDSSQTPELERDSSYAPELKSDSSQTLDLESDSSQIPELKNDSSQTPELRSGINESSVRDALIEEIIVTANGFKERNGEEKLLNEKSDDYERCVKCGNSANSIGGGLKRSKIDQIQKKKKRKKIE